MVPCSLGLLPSGRSVNSVSQYPSLASSSRSSASSQFFIFLSVWYCWSPGPFHGWGEDASLLGGLSALVFELSLARALSRRVIAPKKFVWCVTEWSERVLQSTLSARLASLVSASIRMCVPKGGLVFLDPTFTRIPLYGRGPGQKSLRGSKKVTSRDGSGSGTPWCESNSLPICGRS